MNFTRNLWSGTLALAMLTAAAWAQTETASSQTVPNNGDGTVAAPQPVPSDESSPRAVQPVSTSAANRIAPVRARRDGLWFSTADGSTQLQVHGYVQGDDRMFTANTHGEPLDIFTFRKIRPLFEGTLFHAVDYRFMPDFGQNNPQIQEAYLELKTIQFAKLRVGKFKEPMGLEVLRQDRELTFAERSLASDLVPLRYFGAQISGSVLSDSIGYASGYFNGSNDGSNGVFTQWAHGNEGAGRLFFHPFATTKVNAIRQLGFGLAGSAGHQYGAISGLKTMGQNTFFRYSSTTVANGQHNRLAPQAYYYAGPFGLMGEYVLSSQDVLNNGVTRRLRNQAWQVEGSVVLTGEKNSYAGVKPRNSMEHSVGFRRWGGVELAVRYSQLAIDGDAFPLFAKSSTAAQLAKEEGIGVNWYLNRYVRLMTDYEHTGFRMAPGVTTPLHSENVLMSRVQLAF